MTSAEKTALIARTDGKLLSEISNADVALLSEIQKTHVATEYFLAEYHARTAIVDLSDADPVGLYADDFA